MNNLKLTSPWVLFELNDVAYAVSSQSVLSLNQTPQVTKIPATPPEVRGVMNFRGKIIQLVDTRILLGKISIAQEIYEFSEIIDQRYKDHTNWIATLEKNIADGIEFTLTTNPHKCAFGKWFDNYNLTNASIMFSSTFSKFTKPHSAIHKIAITATELIEQGKKEEAINLINSVKETELNQMLHLFEDIKIAYEESRREIILVLGDENKCVGLSVDKIISIEHLFEIDEDLIKESLTETEYLDGIAKRKDGSVVFILNDEYILSKYH